MVKEAIAPECLRSRRQEPLAVVATGALPALESLDADGRVLGVEEGEYVVLGRGVGGQG